NGVWNLNWGIHIGYVVDYIPNQCSYYNDDDHVHLETYRGARLVNWWQQLYQGSTAVYRFNGALC
ncbi:hypothetical protein MNBD_CHLOROFLEXI01-525, partial [hydrothermal vent metagenome]